jgi:prepilin-type processing-associated H-X9-DG protein
MKQFGLAMHTYHDVCSAFPAARSVLNNFNTNAGMTPDNQYSRGIVGTIVFLLPYFEQSAFYEVIESTSKTVSNNSWPWHSNFSNKKIPTLYCPSDQNTQKLTASGGVPSMSRMSIMVSHGDGMCHNNYPDAGISSTTLCVSTRGIFAPLTYQGFTNCTDGTSNTIAASETVSGEINTTKVKGGIYPTNSIYVSGNAVPAACLTSSRSTTDPSLLLSGSATCRGMIFTDGRITSAGFCTVLPPNSPSCVYPNSPEAMSWGVLSATSNHTGGVNGVFVDGSVHFISDAVNAGTATSPQKSEGKSPYGVWGALGTPAGDEAASLP